MKPIVNSTAPQTNENGFSLMEILIAMMMMTIVMGVSISLLNRFQTSYRYEEAYADAQRNARFALARLNEIVRSAGTNPTAKTTVNPTDFAVLQSPTTTSGTAVSSASIQLKSDLNGDSLNTTHVSADSDVIVTSENMILRLDATNRRIMMDDYTTSPVTSTPIADNVISLTFTDPNGSTNTNKTIVVTLVAVPNGISRGDSRYREVSYSAAIRLRNR
ncbi:MAG: prepilin-type N-terminal cleavage/methylation domain-containing protein [Acidobacteria bacterium]|nr:prepilin-type N-terminal cleavage/methylation domain-containing protein [Acidobacteriota bacterium]